MMSTKTNGFLSFIVLFSSLQTSKQKIAANECLLYSGNKKEGPFGFLFEMLSFEKSVPN